MHRYDAYMHLCLCDWFWDRKGHTYLYTVNTGESFLTWLIKVNQNHRFLGAQILGNWHKPYMQTCVYIYIFIFAYIHCIVLCLNTHICTYMELSLFKHLSTSFCWKSFFTDTTFPMDSNCWTASQWFGDRFCSPKWWCSPTRLQRLSYPEWHFCIIFDCWWTKTWRTIWDGKANVHLVLQRARYHQVSQPSAFIHQMVGFGPPGALPESVSGPWRVQWVSWRMES